MRVRHARSAPVLAELKAWLDRMVDQVLPQSALGKAIHYALGQYPKLQPFLTHPEVPLDTNRTENAILPFVVGRKGWLFSDTVAGARLYSLVETAKANSLEPHAYLAHLFTELPKATCADHLEALLPWNTRPAPLA